MCVYIYVCVYIKIHVTTIRGKRDYEFQRDQGGF